MRLPPEVTPDDVEAARIYAAHVRDLLKSAGVESNFTVEGGYVYAATVYIESRALLTLTVDQLYRAFVSLPDKKTPDEKGVQREIGDTSVELWCGSARLGGREVMEFRVGVHSPRPRYNPVLHVYVDFLNPAGDMVTVDMLVAPRDSTRYLITYVVTSERGERPSVRAGSLEVDSGTTLEEVIRKALQGANWDREPVCCRE